MQMPRAIRWAGSDLISEPRSYEKAADVTGDVYRCVRSLRLWDEAHGYAESLGPFENTMSDNKRI